MANQPVHIPRFTTYAAAFPLTKIRFGAPDIARSRQPFATADALGNISIYGASVAGGGVVKPGALFTADLVASTSVAECAATDLCFVDQDSLIAADARGFLSLVAFDGSSLSLKCKSGPFAWGAAVALDVQAGKIVAVGEDGSVAFVELANMATSGRADHIHDADSAALTSVKWRTATDVVVATDAGRIALFDSRSLKRVGSALQDLMNPDVGLNCIAVHPTFNTRIATGCEDGTVKVWDLRNTKQPEVQTFNVHSGDVWDIAFPPEDANNLVTCSQDGTVAHFTYNHLQNAFSTKLGTRVVDKNLVKRFSGKDIALNSVSCSREHGLFAAVGDAGQIILSGLN